MSSTLFLLLLATASSGQSTINNLPWISFDWDSADINGQHFSKTAILIPLTIKNVQGRFVTQFDLGADLTMFYGNTFKPYSAKYKFLNDKIINEDQYQWLTDATIFLNKVAFKQKRIFIRKDYGDEMTADSVLTNTTKFLGTIGADFVQGKVLIIDYPRKRLCVIDSLSKNLTKEVEFITYESDQKGRVILPLEINDETMNVMFDTGNSMFGFTSTRENWAALCDTSIVTTLEKLNSWGTTVDVLESPIKGKLIIKGTGIQIDDAKLSFLNPAPKGMNDFFSQSKISGLTGNVFFLNNCVIIDFKNEKFRILNTSAASHIAIPPPML